MHSTNTFSPDAAPKTVVWQTMPGIGDLVWHLPYIRAVAAQSRGGKVWVISRPSTQASALLALEPCVEAVIDYHSRPRNKERGEHDGYKGAAKMIALLKTYHFDRAIVFTDKIRHAYMIYQAAIPQRLGFGNNLLQRYWLNKPPYILAAKLPGNQVYNQATELMQLHGFVEGAIVPKFNVPPQIVEQYALDWPQAHKGIIAFSFGASDPRKDWGLGNFTQLALSLAQKNIGVVVLGGSAEAVKVAELKVAIPDNLQPLVKGVVSTNIVQTAAMLSQCLGCVGNDTGVLNMAAALNVPCLGLFGFTDPLQHDPLIHSITGTSMQAISCENVLNKITLDWLTE